MRLSATKATRGWSIAVFCFVYLGLGAMTSDAINYNDSGTTNYLGWATNDFRLKVGVDEPDNTLIVTNGGIASVTEVYVGELSTSTNNLLSVTNGGLIIAGSANTNTLSTGGIVVGDTDGKGLLSVNHSSEVDTDYLYIGHGTNESGTVTVENKGMINVREQLFVGSDSNSNNVLDIKSGGSVFIHETTDLVIRNASGTSNDFNTVNIESTGRLLIGGDVNATSFTTTSNLNFEAGAVLGVGGALTINNSAIEDELNILLDNDLSSNTSRWDTGEMYIGDSTGNNSLTLTNGAQATASDLVYVGNKASSAGNTITVTGTNSLLAAGDKILIGAAGDRNILNITEGGQVTVAKDLKLGASLGSDNNSVMITGTNSSLTVAGNAIIGEAGAKNSFTLTDATMTVDQSLYLGSKSANNRYTQTGGTNTVSGEFIIGKTEEATGKTGHVDDNTVETTGNLAMVGEDATLNLQQNLIVGQEGGGSILTIRDGGTVNVAGDALIGESVKDNYIYLQRDADTRFNVDGDLVVGKEGGSNRFAVYGGTATIDGNLYLGSSTNQHEIKNFIHVETTNAVINVANAIHIGASNSINTLDLVGGATVTAQDLFVGAYEGVTNNVVSVTGDDSLLSISNILAIGSSTGSNNTVNVSDGGTLFAIQNNIQMGSGTNNTLNIESGGTFLTMDWDFAALTNSATNIVFHGGSTLELSGTLSGTNQIEGGLNFVLDGNAAEWNVNTNLFVGNETDGNTLTLTNGASVTTSTNLYIGYVSQGNLVTVGGTGSVLNVGADLFISNSETNTSGANSLFVLDGAQVMVGNNAFLSHGSILKIDSKSQVHVGGDYEQDNSSILEIGISSNQVMPNLIVDGNAEFTNNATITVYDDGVGESNVVNIVKAGSITIGGETASTGLLYDNIQTNLLLGFNITISNSTMNSFIVLDNFIKRSLSDAAGLEGMLAEIGDEIQAMAKDGDERAVDMLKTLSGQTGAEANKTMDNYYGEKASSAPMHNVINQGIAGIADQLAVRGDNTRARQAAGAESAAPTPVGAEGPHASGQELQGWIAGYGSWADRSAADGFDAYDANLSGFIIGADLAVSQNILVGVAGGANAGSVDKNNGATGDTKTTYGSVYASLGTHAWFLDGSMLYGSSSIDNTLGDVFDTTASYDAQNIAFYLGGGKEITGQYLIITPKASLLANYYQQDAYDEKSTTTVPRSVDSFDALYVQSSIGCNLGVYMAMGEVTLKPELRVHWLHEFNANEEDLSNTLIGGSGTPYKMVLQAPVEDIIRLGAGVAAKMSDYLELRFDLDTQQGGDYSDYTVLGSLRYQF